MGIIVIKIFSSKIRRIMKKIIILSALLSIIGINLQEKIALAQINDNCYFQVQGKTKIDLSRLCGGSKTNQSDIIPGLYRAKIKRRDAGTPVIEVIFNGGQKFEMLLDTGATQTTITKEMAKAINLVSLGAQKVQIANGEYVKFPYGKVASIEVGGAKVDDLKVSVGPIPLLGQNFFDKYELTIKKDVVEFKPH
jgi:predicted aspartyl protease